MGFQSVYRVLQELFPTVDARVLKAVAIEHPKDADLAAEVVLNEILPSINNSSKGQGFSSPVIDLKTSTHSGSASIGNDKRTSVEKSQEKDHNADHEQFDLPGMSANVVGEADKTSAVACTIHYPQLFNPEMENYLDDSTHSITNSNPLSLGSSVDQIGQTCVEETIQTATDITLPSGSGSGSDGLNVTSEMPCTNYLSALTVENNPGRDMVEDPKMKSLVAQPGLVCTAEISANITDDSNSYEIPCTNDSFALNSVEEGPGGEIVNAEDSNLNSVLTQSGLACRTDVLDEIIENAKSYKKNLYSATELVIALVREVEYHERDADEAKEEAAKGGLEILKQVEELKRTLLHAKEGNDMHAGEVYGEKAILATEVKELQSRLLSLSDEKDNSIAILDEMRRTLEARLLAAGEVRKAAEKEKLEREESAKKALAEQVAMMEMVNQESKSIQQQAEENSKLREFLVDRGRLVDALQGEISVICKDVRLLKEKLDQRLPLSESVSSSQTSCKLASSSSSFKSKASDLGLYRSDMILKESTGSSVDDHQSIGSVQGEVSGSSNISSLLLVDECQSPRTRMSEERVRFDQEMLVDDGWEICNRE